MKTNWLEMARIVSKLSRCSRRKFGAVLVRDDRLLAVGYNGTPNNLAVGCQEGGCPRCADKAIKPGEGYDRCICVHAEVAAVLAAAKVGTATNGTELYTQSIPCLYCMKELMDAGVAAVYVEAEDPYVDYLESYPQEWRQVVHLIKDPSK